MLAERNVNDEAVCRITLYEVCEWYEFECCDGGGELVYYLGVYPGEDDEGVGEGLGDGVVYTQGFYMYA